MRRSLLTMGAMVLVGLWWWVPAGEAAATQATFAGKRAIFDEDVEHWMTKAAADATLQRVKEAGFSVYVPCIWHGRGTSWPSQHAPWDWVVAKQVKPGYDPMKYLVEKAHALGLEVHPWFTLALRQYDIFPELALPGKDPSGNGAFDVHNLQFQQLITDLVAEVVSGYDVDGVNLDYVRAVMVCTIPSCRVEYERKYGRDLANDERVIYASPETVPTLVEYQQQAVAAMVTKVSGRIRQIRPQIPISIDADPDQFPAYQGQDSIGWTNKGLIDVLFRMDYGKTINVQLTDSIRTRLSNPDRLTLLVGNYEQVNGKVVPRNDQLLKDIVMTVQTRWPKTGIGIYLFSMLSDEQTRTLKTGVPDTSPLNPPSGFSVR